jgi:glycogen operon protein
MGDEMRRTQAGNNNAYCRDDASNWLDWTLLERHADVHRFVKLLNVRRVRRDDTAEQQRISLTEMLERATLSWHGVKCRQPDWGPHSHALALDADMRREGLAFYLIMNAFWEPLDFELPAAAASEPWRRWIDTSLPSPEDIGPWRSAQPLSDTWSYRAAPRSVAVLWRHIAAERPERG